MKKEYDLRYEGGRCQIGYEFVEGFERNGKSVRSFCRKIPKYRFSDPLSREDKVEERERRNSHNRAVKIKEEMHRNVMFPRPDEVEL